MSSVYSIARSGLENAVQRIAVSASNSANAETNGFVPSHVVSTAAPDGGVTSSVVPESNPEFDAQVDNTIVKLSGTSPVEETVNSIVAVNTFKSNLASIYAAQNINDALLSIRS